jgi:hypothetical protein
MILLTIPKLISYFSVTLHSVIPANAGISIYFNHKTGGGCPKSIFSVIARSAATKQSVYFQVLKIASLTLAMTFFRLFGQA